MARGDVPYWQQGAERAAHARDTVSCDVESSAIAAIGYNSDDKRLVITFNSGKSYAYYGVSTQRYNAFCDANSKGKYFNRAIRNNYNYRRLG